MSYEITIRCYRGKGNPIDKEPCATHGRDPRKVPSYTAATSRHAIYAVEQRAAALGWKKDRGAGRPVRWICPMCQRGSAT